GFYRRDSGHPLGWRVEDAATVARAMLARDALGLQAAIVLANPVPAGAELDGELHDRLLDAALAAAAAEGISGQATTPFLLDRFHSGTGGASLGVNIAIVRANAAVAAEVAAAWSVLGASG